jgi:hypothetical protein
VAISTDGVDFPFREHSGETYARRFGFGPDLPTRCDCRWFAGVERNAISSHGTPNSGNRS